MLCLDAMGNAFALYTVENILLKFHCQTSTIYIFLIQNESWAIQKNSESEKNECKDSKQPKKSLLRPS